MKTIFHWIIAGIAIAVASYILPGVHVDGAVAALVVAVVLGAINAFIRPVLIILTLPLSIITLGFFILILNALLVMLAAAIVPGFAVDGFLWAFAFGIVLALVNWVFEMFAEED
jgi:putative membrane protein